MSRIQNPDLLMDDYDNITEIEAPKNFEKMPSKKPKNKSVKKHDKTGNKKSKHDKFFEDEFND